MLSLSSSTNLRESPATTSKQQQSSHNSSSLDAKPSSTKQLDPSSKNQPVAADDAPSELKTSAPIIKSLLKKSSSSNQIDYAKQRHNRNVSFNQTVIVFCEELESQSPSDLFEPPTGYEDSSNLPPPLLASYSSKAPSAAPAGIASHDRLNEKEKLVGHQEKPVDVDDFSDNVGDDEDEDDDEVDRVNNTNEDEEEESDIDLNSFLNHKIVSNNELPSKLNNKRQVFNDLDGDNLSNFPKLDHDDKQRNLNDEFRIDQLKLTGQPDTIRISEPISNSNLVRIAPLINSVAAPSTLSTPTANTITSSTNTSSYKSNCDICRVVESSNNNLANHDLRNSSAKLKIRQHYPSNQTKQISDSVGPTIVNGAPVNTLLKLESSSQVTSDKIKPYPDQPAVFYQSCISCQEATLRQKVVQNSINAKNVTLQLTGQAVTRPVSCQLVYVVDQNGNRVRALSVLRPVVKKPIFTDRQFVLAQNGIRFPAPTNVSAQTLYKVPVNSIKPDNNVNKVKNTNSTTNRDDPEDPSFGFSNRPSVKVLEPV